MSSLRKCFRAECDILTSNAKFCSRSCNASHNNVVKPKRKAAFAFCIVCNHQFAKQPSRKKITCSRACLAEGRTLGLIDSRVPKPEELFVRSGAVSRQIVKVWILRWKIMELKCSECGIVDWRGKPAPIHLDHINGDRIDHRLENLRMLCANCHGQTPTFGRKNKTKY